MSMGHQGYSVVNSNMYGRQSVHYAFLRLTEAHIFCAGRNGQKCMVPSLRMCRSKHDIPDIASPLRGTMKILTVVGRSEGS